MAEDDLLGTIEERMACHKLTTGIAGSGESGNAASSTSAAAASAVNSMLAWLLRTHAESVLAKGALARGETRFADTVCQEFQFCSKWIDPVESRRKEVEQLVDAVFS